MTSRDKENPDVTGRRDALLEALRTPGDNTALVAQRARRLLQLAPVQVHDRLVWLRGLLPNEWHYNRTLEALRATRGTSGAQPPKTDVTQTGRPRGRRRRD